VNKEITLRRITAADEDFLYRVYASTREEELGQTGWDREQKEAFLKMQFAAQHRFYSEQFPQAALEIVELDREPVGRFYRDRRPDEIRLIDIALLPEYRNKGIGTGLLSELLEEARQRGIVVRIHVEHANPALALYQRLGFYQIDDQGVYYLMEWSPGLEVGAHAG
jgi:ribosomal protein S18 acetylase RimI-like enzyme